MQKAYERSELNDLCNCLGDPADNPHTACDMGDMQKEQARSLRKIAPYVGQDK